jgi:signal peptidase I
MRKLLVALCCAAMLGGVVAFLTGAVALVETYGNSMAPRINAGDLVMVRASNTYRVGDVVAYTSADLHQTVLHRVVSVTDGRYTLRGDHNDYDDPERPTLPQLKGTELVHIPSGGVWLDRLTSPTAQGVLAFALLAGGAATGVRRRRRHGRRHGRKSRAISQHAAPSRSIQSVTGWAPWLRATVAIAAATGSIGLLLGAVAWTRPTTTLQPPTDQPAATMAFTYHAKVAPSPAYDGIRVTAPAPIFRKLTDQVDLDYSYRGDPGTVILAAELSTTSGWQSTVPLQRPVTFDDTDHTGRVHLDLKQLETRAQAAADTIGIPAAQVEIAVVATIRTDDGHTFAPRLSLTLTPTQLALPGGTQALTVNDTTPSDDPIRTDHTLGMAGYQVPVSTLRTASAALALGGLLTLCVLGLPFARTAPNEAAVIRRRYATMLLRVEPVTSPPGRPVIDVTDFPALARLADRYGLMVMHWTRSDVETYIVHDDGITYRYRTGTGTGTGPTRASTGTPRAADDQPATPA